MIAARISADALKMTVCGHAGYAESGSDIVCAGVSMLAQTLAAHMLRNAEDDLIELNMDDGMVLCMRRESPNAEEYRALYAFVQEGLELLAAQYPEYVSVHTD